MFTLGEPLRHDLGDRAVSPVVVVQQLSIDIEFRTVISGGLEGVIFLFVHLESRLKEQGIVVQGLVDVHKVEIILHSDLVRIPEFREVRKMTLRPVQPKFVIDHGGLIPAA